VISPARGKFHLWGSVRQGLGTSKDSDARDYFSHMEKHMIPFSSTQDGDRELIELAFSKKKADDRKEWLRQFKVCPVSCWLTESYSVFVARNIPKP
jgi:C-terminal associated domain of TOPRIM